MEKKRGILAVSFGTSYPNAREMAIGGIEEALKRAFPGTELYRCFTSGMVIRHMEKSEGIHTDTPQEALERMQKDGITDLLIQPTHVLNGAEYQKFRDVLASFEGQFESVQNGAPLLAEDADIQALAYGLRVHTKAYEQEQTAIVLVGHGSETEADQVYGKLQKYLLDAGRGHYYVGTIESAPTVQDILAAIDGKGYTQIVLVPLMVVAGDHAANDIAGEKDSWQQVFQDAGYQVSAHMHGLGEYPEIQEIYVKHLQAAALS